MKETVTITLDEDLVPKAKAYAKSQGRSLSQLIEQALRRATREGGETFSAKWRGKFKAAGKNSPRYKGLAERFL